MREEARGAVGHGAEGLLPQMSPPHPDRPLATQGGDEPPGFRREKDQGCKGLVSLAEDSHALSRQQQLAGRR